VNEKLLKKILLGRSDQNISFSELCKLLEQLGFSRRTKGDHHIFSIEGIPDIINIQPLGSKAKAYQVKQIRQLILNYRLGEIEDA
jgi:hypothetical protein